MADNTPLVFSGSGAQTITPSRIVRAMLVENTDTTNSFTVVFNGGGPNTWTMNPGTRKGNYIKGGIISITITPVAGSPTWQVELTA